MTSHWQVESAARGKLTHAPPKNLCLTSRCTDTILPLLHDVFHRSKIVQISQEGKRLEWIRIVALVSGTPPRTVLITPN